MPPSLKVMLDGSLFDIRDACKKQPDIFRDTLISALLLIPLDDQNIKRIQLGEAFRGSLQAERHSTPYRLHSVISACKEGKTDEASLEAKFFEHGGARAVTALAAAAADDNNIMVQLENLRNEELQAFLESIDTIEWHRDLLFMAEAMDRKRLSITSKKIYLVRPRPSRSIKTPIVDATPIQKPSQHSRRAVRQTCSNRGRFINVVHDRSNPPFPYQTSSHTGPTDAAKQTPMGKCPYTENAIMEAELRGFEYAGIYQSVPENQPLSGGGSNRIDLDRIDSAPPSLDEVGSDTDYFGIDLDQLNSF
ncbi:hypothetical protein LTR84_011972 [Exophiala bonariae]|uniref:BTB domain-containing protein n=1 Tax=Exophiala bonariae TaxID=1690606 RepID=A0AAV9MU87_9EURO|nr:hypothetical protein LTR84_011972 [Exophiala bonariae]